MSHSTTPFTVNGRDYAPPARPVAVVCLDGSATEYLDAALARGLMPTLAAMSREGWRGLARAQMPTFTNVNNTSIVTGVPPRLNGMGGNYFFDRAAGAEVMMNSSKFVRCPTLFPAAQRAGRKVAVITAKEKLRDIFAAGLIEAGGIAFSSEKAREAKPATHGIGEVEALAGPTPPIYSGEASVYVLRAGAALLAAGRADFLYLSTTDYIQHKHAPEEPEALEFYAGIDRELAKLVAGGAIVAATADHGMNAKQTASGGPNVLFLESALNARFGAGFRVILPITDPYVVHHGALGSFAVIHLPDNFTPGRRADVGSFLQSLPGVTEVYGDDAASKLDLPADRLGDFVVASGRTVTLGRTPEWHDLKAVATGLRSHGGRYEEMVPFVINVRPGPAHLRRAQADLRNFDIFEFACNGAS
jgi:phosphonoacetate hydrolase